MTEINFDNFKVRCSKIVCALANSRSNPVLTEKQVIRLKELRDKQQEKGTLPPRQVVELADLEVKEKNGENIVISDGYRDYLLDEYAWITEGMIPVDKESLDLLELKKGKMCEADGLTLLMRVDKLLYQVHKERIYNDYLSGEIDAYVGEHVYAAEIIADIKNAFHFPKFLTKLKSGLENGQKEQVQGYCDITGAKEGYIVNTLVSNPYEIVEEMRWKVTRKLGAATPESPEVMEVWPLYERSMNFDHMPPHKRVGKIRIDPFTEFEKQKLYDRVKIGRDWLNEFHETYQNLNKQ